MSFPMRLAALGGRVVLGLAFLLPGALAARDWADARVQIYDLDLPNPGVTLPIFFSVEVLAGLALILGYRARFAALLLIFLLLFLMSQQFGLTGDNQLLLLDTSELLMARVGLVGGLLFVFGTGGGPYRLSRQ